MKHSPDCIGGFGPQTNVPPSQAPTVTDDVRAHALAVLRPLTERVLKVLEERHLTAEHTRESDRKDRLSQAVEEASLVHDALHTAVEAIEAIERPWPRAATARPATKRSRPARGALSDQAELMLGLVREHTQFNPDGSLSSYFVPRRDPETMLYGRSLPFPGFTPSGSGDASTLRSLERRELIRAVRSPLSYAYAVTEAGIAAYDEIFKRRNALPEAPVEVDDG